MKNNVFLLLSVAINLILAGFITVQLVTKEQHTCPKNAYDHLVPRLSYVILDEKRDTLESDPSDNGFIRTAKYPYVTKGEDIRLLMYGELYPDTRSEDYLYPEFSAFGNVKVLREGNIAEVVIPTDSIDLQGEKEKLITRGMKMNFWAEEDSVYSIRRDLEILVREPQ